jgi:hypothetical protein
MGEEVGKVVYIGHGGFGTRSEMVLVPPNTTITFLADAGSRLRLPSVSIPGAEKPKGGIGQEGVHWRFDYEKVANLLDNYLEAEKPRKPGDVVPNMVLQPVAPESLQVAQELAKQGKWGGELRWTDGRSTLCDGNPASGKCPTPMLHVAERNHTRFLQLDQQKQTAFKEWVNAGPTATLPDGMADFAAPELTDVPNLYYKYVVEGIPADRWNHDCGGILGEAKPGDDIIWVSCAGFAVDQAALERIGLPEGLPTEITKGTDINYAWAPAQTDVDRIATLNAVKIKDTPKGGTIRVRVFTPDGWEAADLVVIGNDHDPDIENYLRGHPQDVSDGTITVVKKGGAFKGEVTVEGVAGHQQEQVKDALAGLKCDVAFVSGMSSSDEASAFAFLPPVQSINRSQAESKLRGQPAGSWLVRPSSEKPKLAVSYVKPDGTIEHAQFDNAYDAASQRDHRLHVDA